LKILGINGSPRKCGNTEILLDRTLEGAAKAGCTCEKITLSDLKFSPCLECMDLTDDGKCIVDDDMKAVYDGIERADAVVVASPVFFGSISAQTKMMIDRFQCRWRAKYVLKIPDATGEKKGIFISVAASDKEEYFRNSASVIRNFFATINASYAGELFAGGVENTGDILKHPEFLEEAFELGQRLGEGSL